ncbi:MAG TPA: ABC transporter permease [Kofleriaceae bacterium]|nr:ABC transporter permease [Kofleriaceae bacterium]
MIDVLLGAFSLAFVAQALRITVPYLLAALGGTLTERSGIVDLALEGKLLWGAFAAAVVTHETGSPAAGIAAAALAGGAVAAVQALWSVRLGADQVVTGIALNMAAFALTRFLLQVLYGQGANSPPIEDVGTDVWTSPLLWLAIILAVAVAVVVGRTRFGLRLRAVGERPEAVAAAGVSIARVRWIAVVAGGALAGLGGAQLSLPVGGFVAEASGGRGYVALAVVIMGAWRPVPVALMCLGFGAAEALQARMQGAGTGLPPELVRLFPYVLTLVLLAVVGGRGRAPSALGRRD